MSVSESSSDEQHLRSVTALLLAEGYDLPTAIIGGLQSALLLGMSI